MVHFFRVDLFSFCVFRRKISFRRPFEGHRYAHGQMAMMYMYLFANAFKEALASHGQIAMIHNAGEWYLLLSLADFTNQGFSRQVCRGVCARRVCAHA